ncbi:hypothetical protein PV327_009215 [Microctonus hyperodae]|uniref:Uncharacterized protein n=1 Tax=Microctonus hyperodae TaxID=165561 RepID=A0AA39KVR2_MICHY|nr:hypothetical protein PV327_009215 [Microctonus hyperodae]
MFYDFILRLDVPDYIAVIYKNDLAFCKNNSTNTFTNQECSNATRGCRCESGYLRDTNTGFCVSSEQCT